MIPMDMQPTAEAVLRGVDSRLSSVERGAARIKAGREPEFAIELLSDMVMELSGQLRAAAGAAEMPDPIDHLRQVAWQGSRTAEHPFGIPGNGADLRDDGPLDGDARRTADGQLQEYDTRDGWVDVEEPPAVAHPRLSIPEPVADETLRRAGEAIGAAARAMKWERVGSTPAPIGEVAGNADTQRRQRRDAEAAAALGMPDWRQPLTPFEQAAGVRPIEEPATGTHASGPSACGAMTSAGPCTLRAGHPVGPTWPGENGHIHTPEES